MERPEPMSRDADAAGLVEVDRRSLAIDMLSQDAKIGVCSDGLLRMPHLSAFFDGQRLVGARDPGADALIGWGNRASGRKARRYAGVERPFVLVEDGFLRSVGLGKTGAAPVSLAMDDRGVYYDAATPSRLEELIAGCSPFDRTAALAPLKTWNEHRLSKYNVGADHAPASLRGRCGLVVLVDQVKGDASVAGAGADSIAFETMLKTALAEQSASQLAVRMHPDVVAGRASGYLANSARRLGLTLIDEQVSPHAILDAAKEVWTVSSALGFEAVLRGIKTTAFAAPFYAGWGLTCDRASGAVWRSAAARRDARPCVEGLFAAALLCYPRYVDPVTRRRIDFDAAVERILDWRSRDREWSGVTTYCFGFSAWKRKSAAALLSGSAGKISFSGAANALAARRVRFGEEARCAVWGLRGSDRFIHGCRERGAPLLRVEDGFLRSVGLGSDLLPAGSLIIDDIGIYYDARSANRLELLIENGAFDAPLLERARNLRQRLVAQAFTKYNLQPAQGDLRALARGRRIALVVEQVPDDAALRFGGGEIMPNLGLLKQVRRSHPEAFVVYKEHPDLVRGNRRGRLPKAQIAAFADLIVSGGDILGLFPATDEIHVISSLAGFEALLRSVPVHVWGRPFYAGWGLTTDLLDFPRRTRRAALDEVVAASLIVYPRYVDPLTLIPCGVEDYLDSLSDLRRRRPANPASCVLAKLKRVARWLEAFRER